ncbi:NLI interacting factor-like phosphatase family protein [Histomonas meleagridis]|uniref:NLI interacting factor-like phosphatase family protein n=1 Tax=Histomonas meleagridis TaxID=135588 RepID=UPI00355A9563|nr:NLI interacting factor-like phosphatase family protein [Histomonas meleagridis]KAH0804679.1 NLI interacting factor-like phosphatase family protein [Histomonas meleagridis]
MVEKDQIIQPSQMFNTTTQVSEEHKQKPAIVFDLDETLIFASAIKPKADSSQIKIGRRRMYIQFRPGLCQFIQEVSKLFDIFFFTASSQEYGDQIINLILPDTPASHRFFRENCTSKYGYPVKDLELINRPINKILLVDDVEGSAMFQPKNLVRISPWFGGSPDSILLEELLPALKNSCLENDIPSSISNFLGNSKFSGLSVPQFA